MSEQAAAITISVPAAAGPIQRTPTRQLARPCRGLDPIRGHAGAEARRTGFLLTRHPLTRASRRHRSANEANTADDEGAYLEAERAYEQAVALNPKNWAARVNLANLRARRTPETGAAIATVREALDDIRADHDSRAAGSTVIELPWRTRYIEDANYFRLAYQLAAMQLNAALRSPAVMIDGRITSRVELLENSANSARLGCRRSGCPSGAIRETEQTPRMVAPMAAKGARAC